MGYPYDPYGRSDPPAYQYPYTEQPGQYPYYGQQPPPPPPGYYPPPPRRSRAPLYTTLAVVGAIVVALAVAIPLLVANRDDAKPKPTASPRQMIVDEDAYPELGEFTSDQGSGSDDWTGSTTPRACEFLSTFERPDDVEFARATWSEGLDGGVPFTTVLVEDWVDDHLVDQADVVTDDCRTFSFTNGTSDSETEVEAEVFKVDGADAPTTGTSFHFEYPDGPDSSSRWYETVVRETTIRVGVGYDGRWTDDDERSAVELLNTQIQRVWDAK